MDKVIDIQIVAQIKTAIFLAYKNGLTRKGFDLLVESVADITDDFLSRCAAARGVSAEEFHSEFYVINNPVASVELGLHPETLAHDKLIDARPEVVVSVPAIPPRPGAPQAS